MTQARIPGIVAVTTCSKSGFNSYGRRMMQAWAKHWPVPLIVYTEGGFKPPAGVSARPIESIGWLQWFLTTPTRKGPTAGGRDEYRHDAKRFSFKTATVIDAAQQLALNKANRWLIWVDADTYTHELVRPAFVESLLPSGDEGISWLNRAKNYPECGFYVLDLHHPSMAEMLERWYRLYITGELYTLDEWHDSWVLQWVIKQMPLIKPKSISGPGVDTNHPFINGPLGEVMDHLKGPRKARGRSSKHERIVRDDVAYWRR